MLHVSRLVDDLLDVSRITQGKLELKRERVSLESVINAAIEVSRPAIQERRHTLHVALPKEPLWLDADLTRLAQAVSNLLNNASKYTAPRGELELSAQRDGDQVAISVHDNGKGFSLAQPRKSDSFGLIGLRERVYLLGGTVKIDSAPGKGTRVEVRIPNSGATA